MQRFLRRLMQMLTSFGFGKTTTPKLKFFLWACWLDRLPAIRMLCIRQIRPSLCVEYVSQKRKVSSTSSLDCNYAKKVWNLTNVEPNLLTGNKERWIDNNIHAQNVLRNIHWPTLFSFVCNELWITRNKKIFEDKTLPSPYYIMKEALFLPLSLFLLPPLYLNQTKSLPRLSQASCPLGGVL